MILRRVMFGLLLAIPLAAALLWPGDAPFINDEPQLFLLASAANHAHCLANIGLMGSVGLRYGPAPTWIYQMIILIASGPQGWVMVRVLIMFSGMAAGLLLLARALKLWRWFIPVVLLSPYLWFYSRHLWDNTFLLPFSALAVGFYTLYLSEKRRWALLVSITLSVLLPLIHPMALSLAIPLLAHMLIFSRNQLWRLRWPIALVLAAIVATHAGYGRYLVSTAREFEPHQTSASGQWEAGLFPFLGGRILSGWGLDAFFEQTWLPQSAAFMIPAVISCLAYVAVWLGIVFAAGNVWQKRSGYVAQSKGLSSASAPDARGHILLIGSVALVLQMVVCVVSHAQSEAHYHNGLWIMSVLFAWLAVDKAVRNWWGITLVAVQGVALAAVLATLMVLVHQRGGTRGIHYGPTIANQFAVVRVLGKEPRRDVTCRVQNLFSPSLHALGEVCLKDDAGKIEGPLVIEFASDDPNSGRVRVRKLSP